MDQVIEGKALSYPITLYYSTKRYLAGMIGCVLLGILGYVVVPLAQQDGAWIVVGAGWMLQLMSVIGTAAMIYTWQQKKPILVIDEDGVSFYSLLKLNQRLTVLWQDVITMDVVPFTHSYVIHWMVLIEVKTQTLDGFKVQKHFLKPMHLKEEMLNEKEIFNLLEQALAGQTVLKYQPIPMGLRDRLVMNAGFWLTVIFTTVGLAAVGFILMFA